MARMEDIANRLNVSKGTVSKALSGAPDVSETLRKAVLETAVEMGYSRIQRKKDAKCLCVFVENMLFVQPEDFGYDLIMGFRKMAEPAGFSVEVVELDRKLQREIPYDEYMLRQNYVGALFLGLSLSDEWINQLRTSRTPAVLYDNYIPNNPHTTFVGIDSNEGMNLAIDHLEKLGHQKIGYLSSALGSYVYQTRYSAFLRAIRRHDPHWDESLFGSALHTSECVQKHLPRLLDKGVTGILCSHDLLANAAMLHSQELGLRVPEDVSVIGFDDLPLCAYTAPPLTTVRQDRQELGKSAFYAMSSQLGGTPISTLLLHAKLVVRSSTGPAAAGK
ncbi:MAG: LacI family transcriptional regulator [Clostridiales bacterium]|nr:LacI family transcriptional regulator [Clostridiales bacterium]